MKQLGWSPERRAKGKRSRVSTSIIIMVCLALLSVRRGPHLETGRAKLVGVGAQVWS